MEARRWLRGLLVAIAILAVAEGALRLAGLGGDERGRARFLNPEGGWAAAGIYYEEDEDLFWRLKPNASVVGGWYRTNERGFRGPWPGRRRDGVPRVVLLGDSVPFGLGLDIEGSVGAVLGEILEARLEREVQVVQLAVPGYSSHQVARLAGRHVPDLRPDLVVVLAGAFNDQAPACGASDAEIAKSIGASWGGLRRLAIWQGLRSLLGRDRAPTCPPLAKRPPPAGASAPKTRVSVRELDRNLRDVLAVVHRSRAEAIVVVPPLSDEIAELQPWARRHRDAIRRLGSGTAVDAARLFDRESGECFQPDELHPNRRGHLLLARALADRIGEGRALGSPVDEGAVPETIRRAEARAAPLDLAERLVTERRYALALAAFEEAAGGRGRPLAKASEGFGFRARLALARALARSGKTDEADVVLGSILRERPDLVEAHQMRAECAASRGDDRAAIRHLEAGVRADRGWVRGRVLLAQALHALGDDEGARRQVTRGLAVAPEDEELLRLSRDLF